MGHSNLDRFTRTNVQNRLPDFSREKRPELRRKRDSYEPLLTAMAQVLPFLISLPFFLCFCVYFTVLSLSLSLDCLVFPDLMACQIPITLWSNHHQELTLGGGMRQSRFH